MSFHFKDPLFLVSILIPATFSLSLKFKGESHQLLTDGESQEIMQKDLLKQFVHLSDLYDSVKLRSSTLKEIPSRKILIRVIRSDRNNTRLKPDEIDAFDEMDQDHIFKAGFGEQRNKIGSSDPQEPGTGDDGLGGSTSDYVLIAMIVAMMFCMTLCCLCLFCRSSSRLSICGINFELNDRRNSLENGENLSEIHEVVPLTPTTAGDHNNRLPDIESMLRGDAPPPLYSEIVKKAEATAQGHQAKAVEARASTGKSSKRKSHCDRYSESSSVRSNGNRSSWRIPGLLASFRSKSSILRSRRSDSAIQCPTVEEGVAMPSRHSEQTFPPPIEEVESCVSPRTRAENREEVTVETVNEVIKETESANATGEKVFVYDVKELPNREEDDDVFL